MHQNEWFQVWFFKNFLGRGSPSPLPRFLPPLFLGLRPRLGFALNSRALRALDSGFALDTRALCALDSGFALNFRLGILVWPPQSEFLDPPVYCIFNLICIMRLNLEMKFKFNWNSMNIPHLNSLNDVELLMIMRLKLEWNSNSMDIQCIILYIQSHLYHEAEFGMNSNSIEIQWIFLIWIHWMMLNCWWSWGWSWNEICIQWVFNV